VLDDPENDSCSLVPYTDAVLTTDWATGCGCTRDMGLGTDGAKRRVRGHGGLGSNLPATGISVFT